MTVMGGGDNPPVRLDPWQNIINVHWGGKGRFGILMIGIENSYYDVALGNPFGFENIYLRIHWHSIRINEVTPGQYYGYYGIGTIGDLPLASMPLGNPVPIRDYIPPDDLQTDEQGVAPRDVVQTINDSAGITNSAELEVEHGTSYITNALIYVFDMDALAAYGEEVTINFSAHSFAWPEPVPDAEYVNYPDGTPVAIPLSFEVWDITGGIMVPSSTSFTTLPPVVGAGSGDVRTFGPISTTATGSLPPMSTDRLPLSNVLTINTVMGTASFG